MRQDRTRYLVSLALACVASAAWLVPYAWMVLTSFKTLPEIVAARVTGEKLAAIWLNNDLAGRNPWKDGARYRIADHVDEEVEEYLEQKPRHATVRSVLRCYV